MTIEIDLDDDGKHWLTKVREQKQKERAKQFSEKRKERLRALKDKHRIKKEKNG
jgi:hypothetical protein